MRCYTELLLQTIYASSNLTEALTITFTTDGSATYPGGLQILVNNLWTMFSLMLM